MDEKKFRIFGVELTKILLIDDGLRLRVAVREVDSITTRDIIITFKEMYDANVSPALISKVTDAVKRAETARSNPLRHVKRTTPHPPAHFG